MQKKIKNRIRISKAEKLKRVVIFILSSLLVLVVVFNVNTFSRLFNMYNYDRYLNSLYKLKQSKGLSALAEINSSTFAYIECEDLNMHLPVVETKNTTEEDFYINHDFRKQANELGCPYQKSSTKLGETTVSTLVGHSAFTNTIFNIKKDQSIFGKLNQYLYRSTAYNYKITVETFTDLYTFKVVGVMRFNVKNGSGADEMSVYSTVNISSQSQFDSFYQKIQNKSVIGIVETPHYGDTFLTLFTCSTSDLDYRVMVVAKQVSKVSVA